jgi:hypothetical protein
MAINNYKNFTFSFLQVLEPLYFERNPEDVKVLLQRIQKYDFFWTVWELKEQIFI